MEARLRTVVRQGGSGAENWTAGRVEDRRGSGTRAVFRRSHIEFGAELRPGRGSVSRQPPEPPLRLRAPQRHRGWCPEVRPGRGLPRKPRFLLRLPLRGLEDQETEAHGPGRGQGHPKTRV